MSNSLNAFLPLILFSAAVTGCATTHPVNYQRLASAPQLAPNVYSGPDQQFGDTSDADKAVVAAYMQKEFAEALKPEFALAEAPGPATLRVHLTLTGLETNTPVLSSLTKIAPINLIINVVQTARDKQAIFTGSASYAVEIYDSASNQLLRAYVTKQYPFAENLFASFGTSAASRAGIRNGARDLVTQLDSSAL